VERREKDDPPQLEFAICLSGFKLRNQCYEAFYSPRISTPMFHAVGELDATITPAQTETLALDCLYPWFYQFFGGHYVPQSKEYMSFRHSLEEFLRDVLGLASSSHETWSDVDVFDVRNNVRKAILPPTGPVTCSVR
jgi:hypothetical protein